MTQTQKADCKLAFFLGLAVIAMSFIAGVLDGVDKALEAQERHNHLSVYCQQAGSDDEACGRLKAE